MRGREAVIQAFTELLDEFPDWRVEPQEFIEAERAILCEHMFVTSQGSAYARFRRALATRNLLLVKAAAAELQRIDLRDALEVCLLMRDAEPGAYERAAVRWLGRLALERPGLELADVGRAVRALEDVPERAAVDTVRGLVDG